MPKKSQINEYSDKGYHKSSLIIIYGDTISSINLTFYLWASSVWFDINQLEDNCWSCDSWCALLAFFILLGGNVVHWNILSKWLILWSMNALGWMWVTNPACIVVSSTELDEQPEKSKEAWSKVFLQFEVACICWNVRLPFLCSSAFLQVRASSPFASSLASRIDSQFLILYIHCFARDAVLLYTARPH